MDMSKLSASDRRIFITALVVVVGGVVSIIDRWGIGGILGGLAGLAAALVVLQPQMMPTMKLPAPKATSLLVLGGIAAVGFVLSALQYLGFVFDIRLYTILFDIALVAAIVLFVLHVAWRTRPRPRRQLPPRRRASPRRPRRRARRRRRRPRSRPPAGPDPGGPPSARSPTPGATRRAFFPLGVGDSGTYTPENPHASPSANPGVPRPRPRRASRFESAMPLERGIREAG